MGIALNERCILEKGKNRKGIQQIIDYYKNGKN